jgi:hypothetical protein
MSQVVTRSAGSTGRPVVRVEPRYQPRHARFIRLETLGDWRLKVYGLSLLGRPARPELIEATVELAAAVLPRPALAEDRYGAAFAIAHDAATASIGLVYFWQSANELHQRCYAGPLETPRAMTPLPHPAAGCVWEMAIIGFERQAWLDEVLASADGGSIDRYLARRLDADV